ncbi:hypothetical protein, partial [Lactobacillus delbrueckii]
PTNCRDNCTNLQYQLHPTEIWIQLLQLAPRVISWIAYSIVAMLIQQEQLCSRKNRDKKLVWDIRRLRKDNYE